MITINETIILPQQELSAFTIDALLNQYSDEPGDLDDDEDADDLEVDEIDVDELDADEINEMAAETESDEVLLDADVEEDDLDVEAGLDDDEEDEDDI